MLSTRPRHINSPHFARRYFIPSYIVGGVGFSYGMGSYNNGSINGWATGGYANSDSSNSSPNIFNSGGAIQRPQPAANGNTAAPAAPAEPPAQSPSRDWTIVNNETGDTTIQAQYAGVLDHKVVLRKADGHITLVALDQLSVPDQDYVAEQTGHKPS
jgi:hypothetical protein